MYPGLDIITEFFALENDDLSFCYDLFNYSKENGHFLYWFPHQFHSQLMWSEIYDFGLVSFNVVLFLLNVVSTTLLFSVNLVSKTR